MANPGSVGLWHHPHRDSTLTATHMSSLSLPCHSLNFFTFLGDAYDVYLAIHYYPCTHSDANCHCVVLNKRVRVHIHVHLLCKFFSWKEQLYKKVLWSSNYCETNYSYILKLYILSTIVLWGVCVQSSLNTYFVSNYIIYNLSHSMERYCLDVQYECATCIWHSSEEINSLFKRWKREMEWFSDGSDHNELKPTSDANRRCDILLPLLQHKIANWIRAC
jgi:hypothetical protein